MISFKLKVTINISTSPAKAAPQSSDPNETMVDINQSKLSNADPQNSSDYTGDILRRLSDQLALKLTPVFVSLFIYLVLGLWGNSLIVYIYYTKFKPTSSRTAIVALAILDLISTVVGIPGEVLDLRFSFNYRSDVLCRLSRTCATFPNIASGFMLAAVALDRYRRICMPLKSVPTRRNARSYVIGACALSLIFTWPAALLYGTKNIDTGVRNVTGKECSTSDMFRQSKIPLIYNSILVFVFVFVFSAMTIAYGLIGRQVCLQGEFRKTLRQLSDRRRKSNASELEPTDPDAGKDLSHEETPEQHHKKSSAELNHMVSDNSADYYLDEPHSPTPISSPVTPSSPTIAFPNRKQSRTQSLFMRLRKVRHSDSITSSRTRKTTFMLCLISMIFVISFLPHLVVKIARAINKEFLQDTSIGGLFLYNICARSYFLNSFLNVFVYGYCSYRFRKECLKVFSRLFLWKRRTVN